MVQADDVLTVDEVACYLRLHPRTVQRWCRKGELPAAKIGGAYRFRRGDLDRWWAKHLPGAARGGRRGRAATQQAWVVPLMPKKSKGPRNPMAPLRGEARKRVAAKQAELAAADPELRQQMLGELEQRRAAARVERQQRIGKKKRGTAQPPKLPPATQSSKLPPASQPGYDPREDGWLGTWTPQAGSASSVRTVQGGGFETNRRTH